VEEEASAPCPTGLMVLLGTVCKPLTIIHLSAHLQFMVMVGTAPFLVPAVEDYLGVEDAEEFLVAAEGSVVGSGKKKLLHGGLRWNPPAPMCLFPVATLAFAK
jgi:hypothetical protein